MPNGDLGNPQNITVEKDNLYMDEVFTDLKMASVRRLTPVKPDGSVDASRTAIFMGQAHIMTRGGPIPINAPIEAESLEDAFDKFPAAVREAMDNVMQEVQRQQQESSRIITPDQGGGPDLIQPK